MENKKSKFQDLHPAGNYRLKVLSHVVARTKEGKPYLKMKCEVLSLISGGNGTEIKFGSYRFVDLYFTEKTIEKTKGHLKAAGFSGAPSQLDPSSANHVSIAGYEFDASNNPETYESKTRDKFDAWPVKTPGGDTAWMDKVNKADAISMMQMDALFGTVTPQPTTAPTSASSDEEPPFNW
jgi:hypothetical protein